MGHAGTVGDLLDGEFQPAGLRDDVGEGIQDGVPRAHALFLLTVHCI
jgi:hypothetical protein